MMPMTTSNSTSENPSADRSDGEGFMEIVLAMRVPCGFPCKCADGKLLMREAHAFVREIHADGDRNILATDKTQIKHR